MTAKIDLLYTKALLDAGLSKDQAVLYQLLLSRGPEFASRLAKLSGLSRPHTYNLLNRLAGLELVVIQKKDGTPTKYAPAHPFVLQELICRKQESIKVASETIQGVMSSLISEYTKGSQLPGVRILPGIEGIKTLQQDILRIGMPVSLIRSVYDVTSDKYGQLIKRHVSNVVARGITTRVIGPMPQNITPESLATRDKQRLTKRRLASALLRDIPSEILLYGNKTVLTTYQEPFITTIIDNIAITASFKAIFETLWGVSQEAY